MKRTRKALVMALCVMMILPSLVVSAANSWKFSGYMTDDYNIATGIYDKLYYEVDSNGIPTGAEKLDGVAKKIEWNHDDYERLYPHNEIVRLYLDDVRTSVTRDSGALADWETKFMPEMWEVQYPYRIFERLKSNIPGKGFIPNDLDFYGLTEHRGLTNADYLKYLGKNEAVVQTYEYFGFGPYRVIDKNKIENSEYSLGKWQALNNGFYSFAGAKDINGNYIVDSTEMLRTLGINPTFPLDHDTVINTGASLSEKDAAGNYVISNLDIANMISVYKSEYLVGNDYVNGGKQMIDTATYYTKTLNADMFNAHFIMDNFADNVASISWTNEMYEKEFPYHQYQYLIVDDVILDGRFVGKNSAGQDVWLPRVFRYTGGDASPDVKWIYAFAEAEYPHAVYFEKVLDGKRTGLYKTFEQRAGRYGTVVYASTLGELDYQLKSVYGIENYEYDDVYYDGYIYSINVDVQQQIVDAAQKAMQ